MANPDLWPAEPPIGSNADAIVSQL